MTYSGELPLGNWLASDNQPKYQNVMSFRPFNGQIVADFGKLKKISDDMVYVNESTGAPVWYSAGEAGDMSNCGPDGYSKCLPAN